MIDERDALRRGTEMGTEFVIERVLGQGGFGITYEVRALKTINDEVREGDRCVVKEFFPAQLVRRDRDGLRLRPRAGDEEEAAEQQADFERLRASFADEGRALARFFDPGIVRVFMLRQAFETAYLVMEFIEGQSFERYLQSYAESRRRPMQVRDLLPIASKVLDALARVHDGGIIHRDIKPANIMIRANGDPVLIDFGGARPTEQANRSVVLTPGFAPGEQRSGGNIGPWTDIYAMATTFYLALTGTLPIVDLPNGDRVLLLLEGHPMRVDLGIPLDFARAIDWALDYNEPSRRPQSVHAWRAQLFPGQGVARNAGGYAAGAAAIPRPVTGPAAEPALDVAGYDSRERGWEESPVRQRGRGLAMLGILIGGLTALVAIAALVFVVVNPFGAPKAQWRASVTVQSDQWTRLTLGELRANAPIGFSADAPFRVRIGDAVYSFTDSRQTVGLPEVNPDAVIELKAVDAPAEVNVYY